MSRLSVKRIMVKVIVVLGMLVTWSGVAIAAAPVVKPLQIGETVSFHSQQLNESRQLNIYLPADYGTQPNSHYPVIYLLDGSLDEDFIHIAGLVQFGSFPWVKMLPGAIVVGIANVDRQRDFTYPSQVAEDLKLAPTSGGAAKFIAFLQQEVQPLIDKNYRTNARKLLIGQSLGGLMASEILYQQPDLFTDYLIVSPSLWWNNQALLATALPDLTKVSNVYIAVGKEGDVMEQTAHKLFELVDGMHSKTRVNFGYFPNLDHGDTLHLAVYEGLGKIFALPQS